LPAGSGDLRGKRAGKSGILAGPRFGADLRLGAVEPGGAPTPLGWSTGSNGQSVVHQTVQMFANRVRVLACQRREGTDGAGLGLVDQDVQNAGPRGREVPSSPAHPCSG